MAANGQGLHEGCQVVASNSDSERHCLDDGRRRCRTPRRPPHPRVPTSTARPRRRPRASCASGWSRTRASGTRLLPARCASSTATCASARRACLSASWWPRRTWLVFRCRAPGTTRRRRSTGTAAASTAGLSSTLRMERRCPKSPSTRSAARRSACRHPPNRYIKTIRQSFGAIEGGFLQGVGWLTRRSCAGTRKASCRPMRHRPTRFRPCATGRRRPTSASCKASPIARTRSTAPRPSANLR